MAKKLILVTGGARSGKSSYALERAESVSDKRLFLATSPRTDPEMSERVRRHQEERRGHGWATVESETELATVFRKDAPAYEVVLLDCITLWVNNILFTRHAGDEEVEDQLIGRLCREWLAAVSDYEGTVICVTNEVGLGIVPENPLARKYRDLVGTCNQLLGKSADEVVLVSCGIPLVLKNN